MVGAFVVLILPIAMRSVHTPATDEILVHAHLTAAVKNFPVFYVDKVTVYQSPQYPQPLHKLKVFLAKDGCDRLPHKRIPSSNHKPSQSPPGSLPPNETFYLLKGSEMTFDICTVTNSLEHYKGAYLDFRIEEGLEYISKQQRNPRNRFHHSLSFGYTTNLFNQTQPSAWNCSYNLTFTVKKNGYYSIITIPPRLIDPSDMAVWYNFTYVKKVIDFNDNLAEYCGENSHEESNPCVINIPQSKHVLISQHQCIVVEVKGKVDSNDNLDYNFTNIVIEYSPWLEGQSAFVGTGSFVLGVAVFVLVMLLCVYCTARKKKQRHLISPSPSLQRE